MVRLIKNGLIQRNSGIHRYFSRYRDYWAKQREKDSFIFIVPYQGAECDLLMEKSGKVLAAIEIKLGTSPRISKEFRISIEDAGAKAGFVPGNGEETYKIDEKITITNLNYFIKNILPTL